MTLPVTLAEAEPHMLEADPPASTAAIGCG